MRIDHYQNMTANAKAMKVFEVATEAGTTAGNVAAAGSRPLYGEGIPVETPAFIGQEYIDTLAGIKYFSKGVESPNDWVELKNAEDE